MSKTVSNQARGRNKLSYTSKRAPAPYLERKPIQNRRQEIIKLAKEKEEHYIRQVASEFTHFLSVYGSLAGFSVSPKNMELHEIKMAQAASAGDYRLTDEIGRKYLERARAYLELGRLRAWKLSETDAALRLQLETRGALPPTSQEPDAVELKSKKIPKSLESLSSGSLLPFDKLDK